MLTQACKRVVGFNGIKAGEILRLKIVKSSLIMHSWEKNRQIYDVKFLRHWRDCRSLEKWCLNIHYLNAYLVFNALIWIEKRFFLSFRWINDRKFAGAANPGFFWPFLVLKERKGNHYENQHMLNLHDYRPCIKTMSKRSASLNLDKEKICRQKRFSPISPAT